MELLEVTEAEAATADTLLLVTLRKHDDPLHIHTTPYEDFDEFQMSKPTGQHFLTIHTTLRFLCLHM